MTKDQRDVLLLTGDQFANVAFNWAQTPGRVLTDGDCKMLDKLRREWDAVRRAAVRPRRRQEVRRG